MSNIYAVKTIWPSTIDAVAVVVASISTKLQTLIGLHEPIECSLRCNENMSNHECQCKSVSYLQQSLFWHKQQWVNSVVSFGLQFFYIIVCDSVNLFNDNNFVVKFEKKKFIWKSYKPLILKSIVVQILLQPHRWERCEPIFLLHFVPFSMFFFSPIDSVQT